MLISEEDGVDFQAQIDAIARGCICSAVPARVSYSVLHFTRARGLSCDVAGHLIRQAGRLPKPWKVLCFDLLGIWLNGCAKLTVSTSHRSQNLSTMALPSEHAWTFPTQTHARISRCASSSEKFPVTATVEGHPSGKSASGHGLPC